MPFLDHQYAEWASQVPAGLKLRGGEGKYILKKAVEDLLPREIVYRKKMGFPTPLKKWLLQPSAESIYRELNAPDSLISEYLSRPAVAALIDRHRSGIEDATDRIWNLLNLQKWGNIFLRGQPVPRAGELEAVARSVMRILWVKTWFLHPTNRGGQIQLSRRFEDFIGETKWHFCRLRRSAYPGRA